VWIQTRHGFIYPYYEYSGAGFFVARLSCHSFLRLFVPPSASEVVTAVELQRNFRKEGSITTQLSDVIFLKALEILGD
jgi:hypothetical protein